MQVKKSKKGRLNSLPFGAGDRGRTGTVSPPPDFESGTSANSITPAHDSFSIINDWDSKINIILKKSYISAVFIVRADD